MPQLVRLNAVNATFPVERRYHDYFFGEKPLMTVFFRLLTVNLLILRLNAVSATIFEINAVKIIISPVKHE